MRHLFTALVGGVAALALTSAAVTAADLPRQQPVYNEPALVPAPYFTWTGFYIGANLGWGWPTVPAPSPLARTAAPIPAAATASWAASRPATTGRPVRSCSASRPTSRPPAAGARQRPGRPDLFTGTGKTPWFGTIRARVGYAFDRTMVYATGGAVYGQPKLDGVSTTLGPFSSSAELLVLDRRRRPRTGDLGPLVDEARIPLCRLAEPGAVPAEYGHRRPHPDSISFGRASITAFDRLRSALPRPSAPYGMRAAVAFQGHARSRSRPRTHSGIMASQLDPDPKTAAPISGIMSFPA